jgi:tRNA pseudouridine38-40 synthase
MTSRASVPPAINSRLPDDVTIRASVEVPKEFNARGDARSKTYSYYLDDGESRSPMNRRWVTRTPHRLDAAAMHAAAQSFVGRHDFSSFRASACDADSAVRSIDAMSVHRLTLVDPFPMEVIRISVSGRSFLQHQVRAMAGTLVEIGRGARRPEWAEEVLAARNRHAAGPTLPPHGLVLVSVKYLESAAP